MIQVFHWQHSCSYKWESCPLCVHWIPFFKGQSKVVNQLWTPKSNPCVSFSLSGSSHKKGLCLVSLSPAGPPPLPILIELTPTYLSGLDVP